MCPKLASSTVQSGKHENKNCSHTVQWGKEVGPVRRNIVCTGRFIQSGKHENKKIRIVHTQYSGARKSGRSGVMSSVLGGLYSLGNINKICSNLTAFL